MTTDTEVERGPSSSELRAVAPVLEEYRAHLLFGDVWDRPGLAARDRSVVSLAALIARNQTIELADHIERALENGVTARVVSELITHLAFYAGWANAMAAVAVGNGVFASRGISAEQLPAVAPPPLPIDEAAEADRAGRVQAQMGATMPGLVHYTTDVLFRDLWLRPDLAPRDRSLITVRALIAAGQVAQITFHLNRAMDNGLTQAEAAEVITHLAFYAGWPNAMSAVPVAKDVFEKRVR